MYYIFNIIFEMVHGLPYYCHVFMNITAHITNQNIDTLKIIIWRMIRG